LRPKVSTTLPGNGRNKAAKLKAIREHSAAPKRVWLATDCDREGQLIGQEILEHYKYRGVVMRVLFTAQDSQTIRDAFGRAKPNAEYARLYAAAVARRQADQILQSITYPHRDRPLGKRRAEGHSVGRVKTPTLAIVCKRELEIRDFVPLAYFEVVATAIVDGGRFQMRHAPQDRIVRREIAEESLKAAKGFEGALAVACEDKHQGPPKLHDLPSLQKLCSSRFGWPARETLDIAQELYDGPGKKIITYPRAERALPAAEPDLGRATDVAGLRPRQSFSAIRLPDPPVIRRGASGTFYDKGLESASHHAVIPNVNTIDNLPEIWPRLSSDEKKLFDVIARAYLAALMPDFRYRQTTATLDVRGFEFRSAGRQLSISAGEQHSRSGNPPTKRATRRNYCRCCTNGRDRAAAGSIVEDKRRRPPPRYQRRHF